jgi:hypothetical protein
VLSVSFYRVNRKKCIAAYFVQFRQILGDGGKIDFWMAADLPGGAHTNFQH